MEIEEVAAENPEAILKEVIEPGYGLSAYQARKLAFGIGIPAASVNAAAAAMIALVKACEATDAMLGRNQSFHSDQRRESLALDAKFNLDDNAMFRHKALMELRDLNEEDSARN